MTTSSSTDSSKARTTRVSPIPVKTSMAVASTTNTPSPLALRFDNPAGFSSFALLFNKFGKITVGYRCKIHTRRRVLSIC